jgi:hypothetical protein
MLQLQLKAKKAKQKIDIILWKNKSEVRLTLHNGGG